MWKNKLINSIVRPLRACCKKNAYVLHYCNRKDRLYDVAYYCPQCKRKFEQTQVTKDSVYGEHINLNEINSRNNFYVGDEIMSEDKPLKCKISAINKYKEELTCHQKRESKLRDKVNTLHDDICKEVHGLLNPHSEIDNNTYYGMDLNFKGNKVIIEVYKKERGYREDYCDAIISSDNMAKVMDYFGFEKFKMQHVYHKIRIELYIKCDCDGK